MLLLMLWREAVVSLISFSSFHNNCLSSSISYFSIDSTLLFWKINVFVYGDWVISIWSVINSLNAIEYFFTEKYAQIVCVIPQNSIGLFSSFSEFSSHTFILIPKQPRHFHDKKRHHSSRFSLTRTYIPFRFLIFSCHRSDDRLYCGHRNFLATITEIDRKSTYFYGEFAKIEKSFWFFILIFYIHLE